ncbi:MAG: 2-hydroxyacyl-CoA dehydratase [Clostridia bacterium]|nr:2-hydroxyacyl-CoA dehydratase [Clostridia bacterium]
MKEKKNKKAEEEQKKVTDYKDDYPRWDNKTMKHTYKILAPDMLPWHFMIIEGVIQAEGYDLEILRNDGRQVVDEGLKHVHNDTCYPCLCVVGQFIDALHSGKYDLDHTALMITQTGGGCRASNYVPLIRKAIKNEFPNVPVVSINFSGLESDSSFEFTIGLLLKVAYAIMYGDSVMWCYNQTKPYEMEEGASDKARDEAVKYVTDIYKSHKGYSKYKKINQKIIDIFSSVKITDEKKIKVGIVGEIYVKYSYLGNNNLEKFLLSEGCEPVVPALMDFVLYCIVNTVNDHKLYGHSRGKAILYNLIYKFVHHMQKNIIKQFKKSRYEPLHDFDHIRACADKVINQGVKMGEGWLIPAEMAACAETGVPNIVCAQPFGCLPNHIAGKGAIRTLKNMYQDENIVAVDYDPSATRVNQENRIKLMLATARENFAREQAGKAAKASAAETPAQEGAKAAE